MQPPWREQGFTLIEVVVAVAVFVIFALGIYSGIVSVLKISHESRLRVAAAGVLSQEMEKIRSIPYDNVGLVQGNPSGVLLATSSVSDSGLVFNITTTVRYVDSAFDGTATSTPADENPADYKLVGVSVQCGNCSMEKSVTEYSYVAPPTVESAPDTGSLLVHVVDANGLAVEGAVVTVRNSQVNPPVAISAVTDAGGWYAFIGAPTSTLGYSITTTKDGYSTDYTTPSSTNNPSPTKLPASVSVGQATTITFSIDTTGTVTAHTVNSACVGIGNINFSMQGQKLIGSLPPVYKFNKNFTTDGAGNKTIGAVEWDSFSLALNDGPYDLAGTVPLLPFNLLPGGVQDASLVLAAHTSDSLLVVVKDAVTGLPLSAASVELAKSGYDQILETGQGFVGQTDWSLGSGQDDMGNASKYFADSGTVDVTTAPGDVMLALISKNHYQTSGWLGSSTFDLGSPVTFSNIQVVPTTQPTKAGATPLRFQLASSNSSTPSSWNYLGPDGTNATYYTTTNTVVSAAHANQRYLRYRAYLSTADFKYTPRLSDFFVTYTSSCMPPGQAFFAGLSSATHTLTVSKSGYQTNAGLVNINGNSQAIVNLSPQ